MNTQSALGDGSPGADASATVAAVINDYLTVNDIEFEKLTPTSFAAILPGDHRLKTTVSLVVGQYALSINAFVIRQPDENHAAVNRWLLERNRRLYAVAYALDQLGDIYLVGRVSLLAVTADELDRILGSVLENSDGAFDQLLELGFANAIKREWRWRLSRGESTANLSAFQHLADQLPESDTAR